MDGYSMTRIKQLIKEVVTPKNWRNFDWNVKMI